MPVFGQMPEAVPDSIRPLFLQPAQPYSVRRYIGSLAFETRAGSLPSRNEFFTGYNLAGERIHRRFSMHLKYTFEANRGTWESAFYGSPYQGIGVGYYEFDNVRELGNATTVYILQGARIAWLAKTVSLFYEWNLGLSWGWKPYNFKTNLFNTAIGSRMNAYLGAGLYLKWSLSRSFDLSLSGQYSHFSNGNTQAPNRGVNILSGGLELKYYFKRQDHRRPSMQFSTLPIPRHWVYELLFYMTQKGTALDTDDTSIVNPYPEQKFTVVGINFAPLYQLSRKVRVGGAFDMYYNGSASIRFYPDYMGGVKFTEAKFKDQYFIGLGGRIDYTLPFFTLSGTIGYNVVHQDIGYGRFYQVIALKVNVTPNFFLNVGYRVSSFKHPNFLMLGVGYRFNNNKVKRGEITTPNLVSYSYK